MIVSVSVICCVLYRLTESARARTEHCHTASLSRALAEFMSSIVVAVACTIALLYLRHLTLAVVVFSLSLGCSGAEVLIHVSVVVCVCD